MLHRAYIVPGQPHILLGADRNEGWAALKRAYEAVGREIAASGAELMLVYSTQWFSVIGHLFQVDPKPAWTLVDQNWYELGEIPYEFRIDPEFGKLYARLCKEHGMQAATVAYHGFPIDTGTVVALKLLNPNNAIPASVVSCNIYAEREETRALGYAARAAIEAYGKKTIVVVVTNLSNRYEVADIDPAQDHISSQKDDEWNRKILEMLGEGRLEDVAQVARDFAREANADMGFKAIWWLGAVMGEHNRYDGKVWEYQPVWGTGSAIAELRPNEQKQIDWEKEFDEGPVATFAETGGTGLETHNVLEGGTHVTPSESEGPGGVGGTTSRPSRPGPSLTLGMTQHPLREMSRMEETMADYMAMELTTGKHLLEHFRPQLRKEGVLTALQLKEVPNGSRVTTAGAVIVRQRPGTAKGFVFLTLEDETGLSQAIASPPIFAEYRSTILSHSGLIVEGIVQNQEGQASVRAESFRPLEGVMDVYSHDFH